MLMIYNKIERLRERRRQETFAGVSETRDSETNPPPASHQPTTTEESEPTSDISCSDSVVEIPPDNETATKIPTDRKKHSNISEHFPMDVETDSETSDFTAHQVADLDDEVENHDNEVQDLDDEVQNLDIEVKNIEYEVINLDDDVEMIDAPPLIVQNIQNVNAKNRRSINSPQTPSKPSSGSKVTFNTRRTLTCPSSMSKSSSDPDSPKVLENILSELPVDDEVEEVPNSNQETTRSTIWPMPVLRPALFSYTWRNDDLENETPNIFGTGNSPRAIHDNPQPSNLIMKPATVFTPRTPSNILQRQTSHRSINEHQRSLSRVGTPAFTSHESASLLTKNTVIETSTNYFSQSSWINNFTPTNKTTFQSPVTSNSRILVSTNRQRENDSPQKQLQHVVRQLETSFEETRQHQRSIEASQVSGFGAIATTFTNRNERLSTGRQVPSESPRSPRFGRIGNEETSILPKPELEVSERESRVIETKNDRFSTIPPNQQQQIRAGAQQSGRQRGRGRRANDVWHHGGRGGQSWSRNQGMQQFNVNHTSSFSTARNFNNDPYFRSRINQNNNYQQESWFGGQYYGNPSYFHGGRGRGW